MNKKYIENQLLCTFNSPKYLNETINNIKDKYQIINNKIIVISNVENENELFCIYNIVVVDDNPNYPNTILIHRKRKTNTLYTINSLNNMILVLNDGSFSCDFLIPWENYRNTLWRIKGDELDVVKTQLYKTFKF